MTTLRERVEAEMRAKNLRLTTGDTVWEVVSIEDAVSIAMKYAQAVETAESRLAAIIGAHSGPMESCAARIRAAEKALAERDRQYRDFAHSKNTALDASQQRADSLQEKLHESWKALAERGHVMSCDCIHRSTRDPCCVVSAPATKTEEG